MVSPESPRNSNSRASRLSRLLQNRPEIDEDLDRLKDSRGRRSVDDIEVVVRGSNFGIRAKRRDETTA